RESGHGVQQVLPEHDHTPDRGEALAGDVEVAGLEALRLGDRRDALEDERGRVGHDADEPRVFAEPRAEPRRRDARRDRDEELPPRDRGGDLLEDVVHDLGLDREDHDVGAAHELPVAGGDLDGVLAVQVFEALLPHVGREDRLRGHAVRREQALDERLAHVPGADEPDRLALDGHRCPGSFPGRGGRGPKTAVPTRTSVAPSSIATSKSPLMPIESSASPCRSPSLRSARNHGRAPSASGASGGIAMSPRTRTWPSPATAPSSAPSPSGAAPRARPRARRARGRAGGWHGCPAWPHGDSTAARPPWPAGPGSPCGTSRGPPCTPCSGAGSRCARDRAPRAPGASRWPPTGRA